MLVARWQIDARFGHKQKVIDMVRSWGEDIAPRIGWKPDTGRLLAGSIGAREATVEHDWTVEDLAALGRAWDALGAVEAHRSWGKELEPFVVSGSARWEVFRVIGA